MSPEAFQRVFLNVNHKIIAQHNFRFTFKKTSYLLLTLDFSASNPVALSLAPLMDIFPKR
jgi:hypothetical protein